MRTILILFILVCAPLYGQLIVTLDDQTVLENCKIDELKKKVICEENGKFALLNSSWGSAYSAVENLDGEIKLSEVGSITEGKRVLFKKANDNYPLARPPQSLETRLTQLKSIKFNIEVMAINAEKAPPGYAQALEKFQKVSKTELEKVSAVFESENLVAEMQDGTSANCKRLKAKDSKSSCHLYSCGKNDENEKVFLAAGIKEVLPLSDIVKVNEGAIASIEPSKRVLTQDSTVLNNNPNSYGYFEPGADELDNSFQIDKLARITDGCDKSAAAAVLDGIENFNDKLKNKELIQFITLFNGTLDSFFVLPSSVPEDGCYYNGRYYTDESFTTAQRHVANDEKALNLGTAQSLFQMAKEMKDMPWGYTADGCYARAHLMARRFEKLGYDVDKVWAKGDLRVGEGDDQTLWNYHVAPTLKVVDENGEEKRYVIDPSIMDGPVPVEEWTQKMAEQSGSVVNETAFPFPKNAAAYKRVALSYSNSDAYWPYPDEKLTEDQRVKMAKKTLKTYQGYLDEMD